MRGSHIVAHAFRRRQTFPDMCNGYVWRFVADVKQLTQTRVPVAERYLDERNTRPKELSSIKLAGIRISHDLHYFKMILVLDMNIEIIPVEPTTVKVASYLSADNGETSKVRCNYDKRNPVETKIRPEMITLSPAWKHHIFSNKTQHHHRRVPKGEKSQKPRQFYVLF